MRVLIATIKVPFIEGGAEMLAARLKRAFCEHGHQADILAIPFKWYPPERILDHMLACRLLDVTEVTGDPVDRVIGLKFPAYLVEHPNKVLWIIHQHRTAYDLWDLEYGDLITFPNGLEVRDAIRRADCEFIPRAKAVFALSKNVARRLRRYNEIESTPLYSPPPDLERFYCDESSNYFLFPSRITTVKRQSLVIEALARTVSPVVLRFLGEPDNPRYCDELNKQVGRLGLEGRVQFLGRVSPETKYAEYAGSLAVVFTPFDEDYGYVTLESMLSSKAVITCTDSGGPLEFVSNNETGLICEPTAEHIATAMDTLWEDRLKARRLGEAGRELYDRLGISWQRVIEKLLV